MRIFIFSLVIILNNIFAIKIRREIKLLSSQEIDEKNQFLNNREVYISAETSRLDQREQMLNQKAKILEEKEKKLTNIQIQVDQELSQFNQSEKNEILVRSEQNYNYTKDFNQSLQFSTSNLTQPNQNSSSLFKIIYNFIFESSKEDEQNQKSIIKFQPQYLNNDTNLNKIQVTPQFMPKQEQQPIQNQIPQSKNADTNFEKLFHYQFPSPAQEQLYLQITQNNTVQKIKPVEEVKYLSDPEQLKKFKAELEQTDSYIEYILNFYKKLHDSLKLG